MEGEAYMPSNTMSKILSFDLILRISELINILLEVDFLSTQSD